MVCFGCAAPANDSLAFHPLATAVPTCAEAEATQIITLFYKGFDAGDIF
jgi:hypothetical protein